MIPSVFEVLHLPLGVETELSQQLRVVLAQQRRVPLVQVLRTPREPHREGAVARGPPTGWSTSSKKPREASWGSSG